MVRICALLLALGLASLPALGMKITRSAAVFFARGSASATPGGATLAKLICEARALDHEVVIITGHADRSEPEPMRLSERRAENVKQQLVDSGFVADKIYVEGKGASQPMSSELVTNARVEVELVALSRPGQSSQCSTVPDESPLGLSVDAIRAHRLDLLDVVLQSPQRQMLSTDDRIELMRVAIESRNLAVVQRLIRFGIRAAEFRSRAQPLTWAVCNGVAAATQDEVVILVETLLRWGANLEPLPPLAWQRSALRCTVEHGQARLVTLLLEHGADPNVPEATPPLLAVRNFALARQLVSAGADAKVRNQWGMTLLHVARFDRADDIAWLVGLGLDINDPAGGASPLVRAIPYATPEILDAFVASGATIPRRGQQASDALRAAIGNPLAVAWLLDRGVRADAPADFVHRVLNRGASALPALEAMARHGVDLKARDRQGRTPLELAVDNFSLELVERLVELGAADDPDLRRQALRAAERLRAERVPVAPLDSFPPPGWYESENLRLNTKESLAIRNERRAKIIAVLGGPGEMR